MKRPFLPAIGALAAAYCLLALLLALADPLGLYPWGTTPRLRTDGNYSILSTPFLMDVVAKDPGIDTLVLGSSTGHFYTPRMMEEIWPDTRRAFNLSYGRASAADRAVVQRQILRYSHARRFILEVDWIYSLPARDQRMAESFPLYLYDDKWWNDVRGVNAQNIKLALAAVRRKPLWISTWGKASEEEMYRIRNDFMHSAATTTRFAAIIARHKAGIDAPSRLTCDAMDTIGSELIPFVRALSQRGAEVDLLFPPYAPIFYYRAGELGDTLYHPTLLNDVLIMRKCIAEAFDGMAGVRVFAFDDLPAAVDFRNHMDTGHLYNPDIIRQILRSIANGEHRLTPENIEAKNSEMRSNVVHYQVTDGKMGIPEQ
jgi:hypothetical protein